MKDNKMKDKMKDKETKNKLDKSERSARPERSDRSGRLGGEKRPVKEKGAYDEKKSRAQPAPWRKNVLERKPADDVCWGRQPVLDIVETTPGRCIKLVIANNVRPPFLDELTDAARAGKVVYQMAAPEALDALCPGVRHQGVACRVTEVKLLELDPFLKTLPHDKPALIVVLDHIEDPHNLGAVVRSAEAAGASAVVFPKRRSALPGGTVMKVSAGAAMRVPMISVVNIARSVQQLKEAGFWTIGLDNGAETSLWKEPGVQARTAFVVGGEDEGLSHLVGKSCDQLLRIPVQGGVGSLNASVAAALGMFEWSKIHACCAPDQR
ncbi:MAG: 23S rRNA (guanosine(2251)-2'-O)-methyltransferase RlmB [Synergistaceae bacterium]|jgi:23S rRNA (guanosine2251-2'-O)-methyltransferase|nr:23S rRNA (guanosine(2251)-2'-O)-methyltransferase RlmB [Synergistaceae bacterium]